MESAIIKKSGCSEYAEACVEHVLSMLKHVLSMHVLAFSLPWTLGSGLETLWGHLGVL